VVRGIGLACVVVMLVGVIAVVAHGPAGVPSAGARVRVDGRATVVHLDGSTERLATGDIVRAGEEVRVDEGSVVLDLADGGTLEGRAGEERGTRVVVDTVPELVAGDLLVVGDRGLAVDAAGTIVSAVGDGSAAQVARGLSIAVGAYRGAFEVDSAGQERTVPAYRQLAIASLGRPPAAPDPLEVDRSDSWDRRFLGAAMDISDTLDRLSTVFSGRAPAGFSTSATAVRAVLPGLADEAALTRLLTDTRPAGEVLVGAAIAMLGRRGSFAERWDAVFDFRTGGAEWGLVAADQGVGSAVLDTVRGAVNASADQEVAAPVTTAGPPTATTGGTSPGTTGATTPGTTPTTPPPTTPTTPPPTTPPPTPTIPTPTLPVPPPPLPQPPEDDGGDIVPDTGVDVIDDVVQPVEDLLDGLLG
jgi:hypothetical protein